MGLDMYLYTEKYLGDWDHQKDDPQRNQHKKVLAAVGLEGFRCEGSPSLEVKVNVAYWRKANAIHRWFVANVQDNNDDCGDYYVTREKLEKLIADCQHVIDSAETVDGDIHEGTTYYPNGNVQQHTRRGPVLAQKGIAEAILPTTSGFFFGSTDYDEYYLQDLKDTVTQLRSVLDNPAFEGWNFHYHSSW